MAKGLWIYFSKLAPNVYIILYIYFNTCIAPCPKVYQQGVLHVRFLRVVMACVFDPLLPGVCLHASCHTLFFRQYCSFIFVFNSFIFRIILLFLLLFAS